jgi:hypothetical protein
MLIKVIVKVIAKNQASRVGIEPVADWLASDLVVGKALRPGTWRAVTPESRRKAFRHPPPGFLVG